MRWSIATISKNKKTWKCNYCPNSVWTEVYFGEAVSTFAQKEISKFTIVSIMPIINDIKYWVVFSIDDNVCFVRTYPNENDIKYIIDFDFIPNWNPTNIKERLYTLLTFL